MPRSGRIWTSGDGDCWRAISLIASAHSYESVQSPEHAYEVGFVLGQFQRLISEVTLNHVGMVLGLEMSRLARSSKDWHAFFEMCAIYGVLIADEDGVYDGNDPNDRLLLGLKGIR